MTAICAREGTVSYQGGQVVNGTLHSTETTVVRRVCGHSQDQHIKPDGVGMCTARDVYPMKFQDGSTTYGHVECSCKGFVPTKTAFAVSYEGEAASASRFLQLAQLGMKMVRLSVEWPKIQPQKDVFVWNETDAAVRRIRAAGMKVYMNPMWAPAWASEGRPTFETYVAGCSAWNSDPGICTVCGLGADALGWSLHSDSMIGVTIVSGGVNDPTLTYVGHKYQPVGVGVGLHFAADREWCSNPAHIDPEAMRAFAVAMATRYRDLVDWWGIWNEPAQSIYWPPRQSAKPDAWADVERLMHEVIIPFTAGVRSVIPWAKFAGPEADSAGTMGDILQLERDLGLRLFDAITWHPYAWQTPPGFPQDSLDRAEEFVKTAAPFLGNREQWASEIGAPGSPIDGWTQFIDGIVKRGDINLVAIYWDMATPWFAADGSPNAQYDTMHSVLTPKVAGKHRAASTV